MKSAKKLNVFEISNEGKLISILQEFSTVVNIHENLENVEKYFLITALHCCVVKCGPDIESLIIHCYYV